MSVQTGIYAFRGRTVARQEIDFLLLGLEERAPDYYRVESCGPLALGFRGMLIAPEDKEDQPLRSTSGVAVTFDGRLDRRGELACRLGLPETTPESDAKLVLLAYERFGVTCFDRLIGEFAFALWDGQSKSLFFVRSLCGTRPLFYRLSSEQLVWSSELDDLVVKSGIEPKINDDYAIGWLFFHPDIDQSPFSNVTSVPSGSYVEVTHDGYVKPPMPIWHPERISTLHLGSDEEYQEAWRNQVELSITDRLRVRGPMFSELSGGLDSSTIVLIADRILEHTGRDKTKLTTVSYTYEMSENADETFFISIVEKARGQDGIHIPERTLAITLALDDITFTGFPDTTYNFPGMYTSVAELMKRSGARVLLNGLGGDELFCSDPTGSPELADLLIRCRFVSLFLKARKWSQVAGLPLWEVLFTSAVAPLTKQDYRFLRRSHSGALGSLLSPQAKGSLSRPGFRLGLRIHSEINLPSRRSRAFSIRSLRSILSTGTFRRIPGIFVTHPFSHQRLIDFTLSLPMDQIVRPGTNRSLMRRATRGMLPEKIRTRLSKAGPDEALCRALIREYGIIGDPAGLLVCQRGYVSADALSEAIQVASIGRMENTGSLLQVFSLERWLRSLNSIETRRSNLRTLGECRAIAV